MKTIYVRDKTAWRQSVLRAKRAGLSQSEYIELALTLIARYRIASRAFVIRLELKKGQ